MPDSWVRHDLPPWQQTRGNHCVYGLQLAHPTPGAESWVIVERARLKNHALVVWAAFWYPAGCRGLHPNIVTLRFATRTLKAAQLLVELWAGTKPREVETDA